MPRVIDASKPAPQSDGDKPNFTDRARLMVEREKRLNALRTFFREAHPVMKKDERLAFEAAVKVGAITLPLTPEKARLFLATLSRPTEIAPSKHSTNTTGKPPANESAAGIKIWDKDDDSDGYADPDPHGDGHNDWKK